ncbi:cupin domain-containing [Micractinium conductrix]|uniref:Cupin domain-containing n=1 Tax=Micractinium conductrix TaxID=554055 RepID=A0A2P6V3G7_9CHLO|nr:cupin domain-containing [Micractinium conductrix]|eukprot:PSC68614.1 cupin domain-containing [Micractinium conductrix]
MVSSTHEHHEYLRKHKFPVPVKVEDVERDWRPRGYSCDLFVDPPGKEWTDFVHKEDELVTVVKGTMEFSIGGDRCVVEAGDEVFIPAGAKHSTRNVGEGEAQWLYGYA